MNLVEYYFKHVIPTGWRGIRSSFRMWKDLMTGNYDDYVLLKEEDPFESCRDWFWFSLGEDETLPKDFLEYLQELISEIDAGKVELVPFDLERALKIDQLLYGEDDGHV